VLQGFQAIGDTLKKYIKKDLKKERQKNCGYLLEMFEINTTKDRFAIADFPWGFAPNPRILLDVI